MLNICAKLRLMNTDSIDMQIDRPDEYMQCKDAWDEVRPNISEQMCLSSCKQTKMLKRFTAWARSSRGE